MPSLILTPETLKRMSELEKTEIVQGFDRDGTFYTAGRDESHVRINIKEH